jgi:phage/plasmid-like protein (TIGR03299 family)
MPANVGRMFYCGDVPWHGEGEKFNAALTIQQALDKGGLNWEVGEVNLHTAESPPSPVQQRKALVRLDRPPGDKERVLGVVHQGYEALQNRDGANLFDAIFGKGQPVYHTGGYLGSGERVWLLAQIDKTIEVAAGDLVEPYALYSNSHGGQQAVAICLTTIRVVCQNTLNLALRDQKVAPQLRRAHKGTAQQHAAAAEAFWKSVLQQCDTVKRTFQALAKTKCSDTEFDQFAKTLFPLPPMPQGGFKSAAEAARYARRRDEVHKQRQMVKEHRDNGKGAALASARGTLWGALNAVTEFVDHNSLKGSIRSLLGSGATFKQKAYRLIVELYDQTA